MSTTQVAVRLDDELLASLDWLVERCEYDSRGEGIRAALTEVVRQERSRQIGEQIADGYRRIPQTDEEMAWVHQGSGFPGVPDDDDWDDWFR